MFTIPERTEETKTLVGFLSTRKVNETVTYKELNQLINDNVQKGARPYLISARNILERDYHLCFDTIMGVGVKRVDEPGKLNKIRHRFVKIRNNLKLALRRYMAVDYTELNDAEKYDANVQCTKINLFLHFYKPQQQKTIEAAVKKLGASLPPKKSYYFLYTQKENDDDRSHTMAS